ncbi:MAG TPA: AGE family epimerase/isomerase [Intrasporangium sp.]|uniref:AGE family epimerase/isomerase n=1 Tax=Intrasporangium sp. TaxID=1925024 RepID=UPI002D7A38A1|nr:AGE family epimerase/isomerase [Intrasporangium sp.]HET7398354.1 AGE family epimerase/isomerase [Intrasporangium sp.]
MPATPSPSASSPAAGPLTPWVARPTHRRWAEHRFTRMLEFVLPSVLPGGGFAYLGGDGQPLPGREPTLLLTARMTHVAGLGSVLGVPGADRLLEHGIASLVGPFRDEEAGGWFGSLERTGRKTAYEHVHVILAASSALAAGAPGAVELATEAARLVEERFWDEEAGALSESWSATWDDPEPYRGANANMHAVEAFLALGDAVEDDLWHRRALRICERLIDRHARARGWLIPEHFDERWEELPDYNADDPDHPFRPYGATYGHSLEWARLLCALHASPRITTPGWVLEAAVELSRSALGAWGVDGREGLVYTVDWQGRPVSTVRLHWPVCEGIQATAQLRALTGSEEWERWYRRLWNHAAEHFIDVTGSWINELDDDFREGAAVWPGRPDVYHAAGAYLGPLLPPWPFLTVAARQLPSLG